MSYEDRYAIFQQDSCSLPLSIISDMSPSIVPVLDLHHSDVTHRLRYGSGVYFPGIDKQAAEKIMEIFQGWEIATRLIPATLIQELPRPYHASKAQSDEFALSLGEKSQKTLPWGDIWILGCGVIICRDLKKQLLDKKEFKMMLEIKDQQSRKQLKTSMFDKESRTPFSEEELAQAPVYFDIILHQDWRRYRISRREFCYDILGASAEIASKANFFKLVQLISNRAPQAILTKSTQEFLSGNGEITPPMLFDSERGFSGYLRWNCLRLMLNTFVIEESQ